MAQYKAYIKNMEGKLVAHQEYIQTLESSLQEEMSRHAPMYGAGLEALSLPELDTLARIHDEGLRAVNSLQHQRRSGLAAPEPPRQGDGGMHAAGQSGGEGVGQSAQPHPLPVGGPPGRANGMGVHENGHHQNGPWFPGP